MINATFTLAAASLQRLIFSVISLLSQGTAQRRLMRNSLSNLKIIIVFGTENYILFIMGKFLQLLR